jgi:hypothetical protein
MSRLYHELVAYVASPPGLFMYQMVGRAATKFKNADKEHDRLFELYDRFMRERINETWNSLLA